MNTITTKRKTKVIILETIERFEMINVISAELKTVVTLVMPRQLDTYNLYLVLRFVTYGRL